ncbi:UvrD-helicase domain-containing protein [Klebsiella oxytoca]|mgnify:CR=1 FL=1|uniref:DNA 3'-5' helicase II n=2 Tax=Klebsiella/Raoultella group TaxID=2890311 RepID=A0AAP2FHH7_KLEOX|nr:ATP-dependent helicase [Klebsiella oxytoca]EJZ8383599.1 ATP-dependent helicase [Klebsiella oxytoca]EKW7109071.1 ATP-dependent helicase [Klebsiella oxytoca]ELN5374036.1 ATP-dependent helicase [Klebsiella oxytoca]ELV3607549.1 ATP-dependent helicase [Klebsiella oxytoca]MBQ0599050.1 ATP-dependent helicase [Klebsiella oxytoca]
MTQPSDEQLQIINAPLSPLSVIACAGSGKTFTAVRRLAHMRQQLGEHRGRIALLSFSNVAVDTFRQEYKKLVQNAPSNAAHNRVEIDTIDSFITGNVLRPHAYRTMGAQQTAFLVMGGEAFLNGFKFQTNTYPREITKMQVGIDRNGIYFFYSEHEKTQKLDTAQATRLVHRLGQIGAYTHNLGRYWCYRTLVEQPIILSALVRRYPHILIDEAQDIGTVHQAIIELLIRAGCQISLIGDPNQGIYEFAGANGVFLTQYGQWKGVSSLQLTKNFRSVPPILDLANSLSNRGDTADRSTPDTIHGAFFIPYRNAERESLITAFQTAVLAADLKLKRSAVLCRARSMADTLAGNEGAPGQGTVKNLAQAAILRDQNQDYLTAFKLVAASIVGLLANPPQGLVSRITQPARYPDDRALRRIIWAFTRNPSSGLPAATLAGDTQWHPLLLERTKVLLARIAQDHGLVSADNLGNKLAKRGLSNIPLITTADLAMKDESPRIRIDTVHQAKGESLDAVLYLTNREHVGALLAGVDTEVGRIGYVAVTRARNLLWLGVPANALKELRPALIARGFQEIDRLSVPVQSS